MSNRLFKITFTDFKTGERTIIFTKEVHDLSHEDEIGLISEFKELIYEGDKMKVGSDEKPIAIVIRNMDKLTGVYRITIQDE